MKRLFVLLVLLILFTVSACKKVDMASEQALLSDIQQKMYEAFQKGDIEYVKKYNAQDLELFFTEKEFQVKISFSDWIRNFDINFKPAGNVKITVNNIQWIVSPAMAMCKSEETWEENILTKPIKKNYLTTKVYEKRNNEWYVVHVHQSFMP